MALFKDLSTNSSIKIPTDKPGILLVDDEVSSLKAVSHLLELKYNVIIKENGKDALEFLSNLENEEMIQVIISDQRMPIMRGTEFLIKTIDLCPFAMRILLTAYSDINEIIYSINKAAIYKFLSKPIEPEDFLLTVKRAVETYRLRLNNIELITQLQRLNENLEKRVKDRTRELEKSKNLLEKYSKELEHEKNKFEILSTIDELTGLYNRRYILNKLDEEILHSQKEKYNLCVAMLDIDHFKNINDEHGHQKGDEVLREVATVMKNMIQKTDFPGRYGGEEFLLIFPRATLKTSQELCEKIRIELENVLSKKMSFTITISVGIIELKMNEGNQKLIKRVDDLLYKAKGNGRNRIEI